MPTLVYRTYRRTARRQGGVRLVHGRYDGLVTGTVTHPHAQLFVPLAGRAHVAVPGRPGRVIGPEEAVWIPAGLPHAATSLGAAVAFLAADVPPGWAAALAAASGLPAPGPGLQAARDVGLWLAGRNLAHHLGDPPGGDRFVAAGLDQLGLALLAALARPTGPPDPDAAILRALDRVFRDYAEPLTVAGLAAEAGLGVRQFERRFAAIAEAPPRAFLIAVRVAAARELLRTTDLAVEAIAARTGFADPTHLIRTFRAAEGTTPAAWRRLNQNIEKP